LANVSSTLASARFRTSLLAKSRSPYHVYEHPACRFVAGFVGVSNILAGTVSRMIDGVAMLAFGADERVLVREGAKVIQNAPVYLTVRPEKISITTQLAPPDADCRLRGKVSDINYLGTSTSYSVSTGSGDEIVVHRLNSASLVEPISRDEEVWLHWSTPSSYAIGE
jgi:spermidine/putrescine transport system ATP-binding protein